MTTAFRYLNTLLCLSPLALISSGCKPLKASSCMRQSDCNAGLVCQSGQCVAPPSTGENQSTGQRSEAQKTQGDAVKTGQNACEGKSTDPSCTTSSSATSASSQGTGTRPPTGLVGGG